MKARNKFAPASRPTRLYQKVAHALAREIHGGRYVNGQRLPAERDLAHRFDVSRPTIREAIIALEITGLVDVRQGSGVYVRDVDGDDSRLSGLDIGPFELIEARMLIESEIAALAAEHITDRQLEQLDSIIEEMRLENARGVTGEMADRKFHLSIARATNNSAIVAVLEQLWDFRYHSEMCVRLMNQVRSTGVKPIIREHTAIVDALRSRDGSMARAAMRAHLSQTSEGLLAATEIDAIAQVRQELERQRERFAGLRAPE